MDVRRAGVVRTPSQVAADNGGAVGGRVLVGLAWVGTTRQPPIASLSTPENIRPTLIRRNPPRSASACSKLRALPCMAKGGFVSVGAFGALLTKSKVATRNRQSHALQAMEVAVQNGRYHCSLRIARRHACGSTKGYGQTTKTVNCWF